MSAVGAIHAIQAMITSLGGFKVAPDEPPENMSAFPFSLVYLGAGELLGGSSGFTEVSDTLIVELHFTRQILPTAVRTAMPYRDLLIKKLITDPKIDGTVDTITSMTWAFGYLNYGAVENVHVGWRIEIGIKTEVTV